MRKAFIDDGYTLARTIEVEGVEPFSVTFRAPSGAEIIDYQSRAVSVSGGASGGEPEVRVNTDAAYGMHARGVVASKLVEWSLPIPADAAGLARLHPDALQAVIDAVFDADAIWEAEGN